MSKLSKVGEPTAAEVAKFIEENRNQIEQTDPAAIQKAVAGYLKAQREAALSTEFVKRLRTSNVVGRGADINAPNLSKSAVLATVAGHPITAESLDERLKPVIYQLRLNAYVVEKPALDQSINDSLLLAESKSRNIPPEDIVRKEITEKYGSQPRLRSQSFIVTIRVGSKQSWLQFVIRLSPTCRIRIGRGWSNSSLIGCERELTSIC